MRGIRRSLHLGDDCTCQLHWAVLDDNGGWTSPSVQPSGSHAVDAVASRIQCKYEATMSFPSDNAPKSLVFVVLVQGNGQEHWLKSPGGKDFVIRVDDLKPTKAVVPAAVVPATVVPVAVVPAAVVPTKNKREEKPVGAIEVCVANRPAEWTKLALAKTGEIASPVGAVGKGGSKVHVVLGGTSRYHRSFFPTLPQEFC